MASTTEHGAARSDTREGRTRQGPRHAAGANPGHDADGMDPPPAAIRALERAWRSLPRGNTLDEATFERRHLFLCWVLALHVPLLFVFGAWEDYSVGHVALELCVPLACVAFGRLAIDRRLASVFVTAGLVSCSVIIVHLSGGAIEAHFHFFVIIGLIALYQDWVPFLCNVVLTVLSHGLGSTVAGDVMFAHAEGQDRPWVWAAIHGLAVLAACVGQVILWKHTEQEHERHVEAVADLAAADVAHREATSDLLVNLARRNQSLLNRQLTVIADLEQREREPDVLEDLFRLDHLATRIRRNAESLLVLSGDDPARRWGKAVPLGDVVRAAVAEVEDYRRVEVLVNDHIEVEGRAVTDLAHVLAELIENATTFSPPSTTVQVRSQLSAGDPSASVVSIEDAGIGMTEDELRAANALLAEAADADGGWSTMLGFHVVGRLAKRYGLTVLLAPTPGGGITAMVTLPGELVTERRPGAPATPAPTAETELYRRAAAVARARSDAWGDQRPGAEPPGVPAWRELPPAPLPVPKVIAAGAAPSPDRQLRPAPPPPIAVGPGNDRPDLPEPPDWWWESEALVSSTPGTPTGDADGPTLPTAPSGAAAPAAVGGVTAVHGLERRVPGTHLSPALRRTAGTAAGDPATPAAPAPASSAPAASPLDRAHIRSMLSRFQDSQRAGRAAAEPSTDDASQEKP